MAEKNTTTNKEESVKSTSAKEGTPRMFLGRPLTPKYVIGSIIVVILVGVLGYLLAKEYVVARVNNEYIFKPEYMAELEKASGRQVLEGLATKKLIEQEAKAKNITVSDKEIDDEIARIEKELQAQGQTLDQILSFQGMDRDELREQIVIQKTVEKLVGEVTVTDAEVEEFISQNEGLAQEDADPETLNNQAREQLRQQKTDTRIQQLISDIRSRAKIQFFTLDITQAPMPPIQQQPQQPQPTQAEEGAEGAVEEAPAAQ